MTPGEAIYLGGVVVAFTAFALVLAWMSRTCSGKKHTGKSE